MAEAVERDDPGPLLAIPERKTYFDRLVRFDPKYEDNHKAIDFDLAADYQLVHQKATAIIRNRRPVTSIETIVGPVVVDNSWDQDAAFQLDVEVVENSRRMGKDLAAGATLPEEVALFIGCFPGVYAAMGDAVRDALAKKNKREPDWIPSSWLDAACRTFFRVPFDAAVNFAGPPPPKLDGKSPDEGRLGKVKLRPAAIQTPLQSTYALPEPRR